MKAKNEILIDDATVVAFLLLRNCNVTPFKKPDGRVSFKVTGDISKDLQALYGNAEVGILDYTRALKSIRTTIFSMKAAK